MYKFTSTLNRKEEKRPSAQLGSLVWHCKKRGTSSNRKFLQNIKYMTLHHQNILSTVIYQEKVDDKRIEDKQKNK